MCSGYPLSRRIDLSLFNSNCNHCEEQIVEAQWVRVRIRLVLHFLWTEEIPAYVLTGKGGFVVN